MHPLPTPTIHTFELTGADGQPHAYIVQEHAAGDGLPIALGVLATVSSSLVPVLGNLLSSREALAQIMGVMSTGATSSEGIDQIVGVFDGVDLSALGRDLSATLASAALPGLLRSMLKQTRRDGHLLSGPAFFDNAYRANYLELAQAIGKVVAINGFFPLPSTSTTASPAPTSPPATPAPYSEPQTATG